MPVGRLGCSRVIDPPATTDEGLADASDADCPDAMAMPVGRRGWMRVIPFTDPLADPAAVEGALADGTAAGWPDVPRDGAIPYAPELSGAYRKPWSSLPAGAPPWREADGRSGACGA
jgi:hypothetical protein